MLKSTIYKVSLRLSEMGGQEGYAMHLRKWVAKPNFFSLLILVLLLWLPRGIALDHFATPDEAAWVSRSGRFYHAIVQGDFAKTFQHGHPGVTVMWAGTAAYFLRYRAFAWEADKTVLGLDKNVEEFLRAHGKHPLDMLEAGRIFMAMGNTAVLILTFLMVARLVGWWPGLIGLSLVHFDPFYLGLTRLLHLDGLMSSTMVLSFAAFSVYLHRGRQWRDLVISAAAAGLSWLTKSPAFFLLPFIVWLLWLEWMRAFRAQGRPPVAETRRSVGILGLWVLLSGLVFVLLFPAMWVSPLSTLAGILRQSFSSAAEGHGSEIFFNGQIVLGDPGWLFYPLTYLWRTTPLVLGGLLLGMLGMVFRLPPFDRAEVRWWVVEVFSFALWFGIGMSLGAKKFDRYLLPSMGALDWLAGLGWFCVAKWMWDCRRNRLERWGAIGMIAGAIGFQAFFALQNYPYFLTYYNPLLGGAKQAPRVMMIGWGEGLDRAARYLNSLPQANRLRVMSYYPNGCFSYFFNGKTLDLIKTWRGIEDRELQKAHYIVLYIHQWQRQRPDPQMLAYFEKQQPVFVARINGLEYAKVYALHP